MKEIDCHITRNTVFYIGVICVASLLLTSCATRIPFQYSEQAPAARGIAKVKKDKNKNYRISIDLVNLAESNRLVAPKTTYVIWMEGANQFAKNIGKIESESGMMSSTLKAQFFTVSSDRPTKIFITSEENGSVNYPSTDIILTTRNF
jgi:hypothetical protein